MLRRAVFASRALVWRHLNCGSRFEIPASSWMDFFFWLNKHILYPDILASAEGKLKESVATTSGLKLKNACIELY